MSANDFSEAAATTDDVALAEVLGMLLGRTIRELREKKGEEPKWVDEASRLLAGLSSDGDPDMRLATLGALLHGTIHGLTLLSYGDAAEEYISKLLRPIT